MNEKIIPQLTLEPDMEQPAAPQLTLETEFAAAQAVLSEAEAAAKEAEEVKKKVDANLNLRKLEVNKYQYSALCSFTFNCGSTNLARLTKDRTVDQIGQAILLYNKSNGKVLQGLVKRRQWEFDYFFRQLKIDLAFSNFLFKTKPNYRVRKTAAGSIIGSTKDGEYVQIKSITENRQGMIENKLSDHPIGTTALANNSASLGMMWARNNQPVLAQKAVYILPAEQTRKEIASGLPYEISKADTQESA